jgi:hypothetical protein
MRFFSLLMRCPRVQVRGDEIPILLTAGSVLGMGKVQTTNLNLRVIHRAPFRSEVSPTRPLKSHLASRDFGISVLKKTSFECLRDSGILRDAPPRRSMVSTRFEGSGPGH